MDERAALDRACELALYGRGETEPNPCVGAVLLSGGAQPGVQPGELLGEGWHAAFGEAHAERAALQRAGPRSRGATLVCTLEPCCTVGKTSACTDALLAAGVARVVVGAVDPNPLHAGKGLALLRDAGLDVVLLEHAGSAALAQQFCAQLAYKRPWVLAKWAMSADGAVAAGDGSPEHLTGARSDARVQHWRAHADAILVGVQTVVNDDPQLTARGERGSVRPLRRVVLDPDLRTPLRCRLIDTAGDPETWLLARDDADQQPQSVLESEGARVLRVPGGSQWLEDGLAILRLNGVQRLLVEGGPRTHAAFLAAGLVDELAVFLSPRSLGPSALPALPGRDLSGLDADGLAVALKLTDVRVERLDSDVLVRGRPG